MLYKPEKFGRLPTNPLFLLPIGTTLALANNFLDGNPRDQAATLPRPGLTALRVETRQARPAALSLPPGQDAEFTDLPEDGYLVLLQQQLHGGNGRCDRVHRTNGKMQQTRSPGQSNGIMRRGFESPHLYNGSTGSQAVRREQ